MAGDVISNQDCPRLYFAAASIAVVGQRDRCPTPIRFPVLVLCERLDDCGVLLFPGQWLVGATIARRTVHPTRRRRRAPRKRRERGAHRVPTCEGAPLVEPPGRGRAPRDGDRESETRNADAASVWAVYQLVEVPLGGCIVHRF
jgi:hypothetical protein